MLANVTFPASAPSSSSYIHTSTEVAWQSLQTGPWGSSIPPVGQRPNSEAQSVHKASGNAGRSPAIVSELNPLCQQGISVIRHSRFLLKRAQQ